MSLRRGFSLATAVLLCFTCLTGCHSRTNSAGLTPVKFQADWYPQPEHGGFYDAVVKGYLQGRRPGRRDHSRGALRFE